MLIGFYGPPCSAKTTLAHSIFAALKRMGYVGEFVSEYARIYIAKHKSRIKKSGMVNQDQHKILSNQKKCELLYEKGTLVVTDTSTANTCFYSNDLYNVQNIEYEIGRYDILFVTSLIEEALTGKDSNRVHSLDQCRELNENMFNVLNSLNPKTATDRVFYLTGSTEDNVLTALSFVQNKINAKHTT